MENIAASVSWFRRDTLNKTKKLKLTWHYVEPKTEEERIEQERSVNRFYFSLFDKILAKIRMRKTLEKIGLTPDNSVIIGSGILQALDIRQSHDIDVVANKEIYSTLKKSGKFKVVESHGRETLKDDTFEIGTNWFVLDKSYEFHDFENDSTVIDGVRYITLDFLLRAKKSWITEGTVRPKDLEDIKLMEEYQENKYPTGILEWKGKKFNLTWIRTNSLEEYSPVTQVYAVCFNNKSEILMQRIEGGQWSLPGGTPEGTETFEETLRREMIEEVDVKIKNIKVLGVQRGEPEDQPGKYSYQARCTCEVDELLTQTPDPDGGIMRERKFVPSGDITEYIKWGKSGELIFKDAIEVHQTTSKVK